MDLLDLGRQDYRAVWDLQKELVEKRVDGRIPNTLILVEHDPVYTVGRAWHAGRAGMPQEYLDVRALGRVPVHQIERGGKLTYHGPGQIVGYPIVSIPGHDLRKYLRELELAIIDAIADETGLSAAGQPKDLPLEPGQLYTGVWIGNRKVASIGVAVRHWVGYHGFALNVSTDLRYFQAVNPCGFSGDVMTTLEKEAGRSVDFGGIKKTLFSILRDRIG